MRTKAVSFFIVLSILFFLSYLMLFVSTPETVRALTAEDHLYENTQAVGDLFASILFLLLFIKGKLGNDFHILKTKKNVFFLFLAILFFFGFGEEISWGQRIFHWQTPAHLAQINVQDETNIHNLEIFNNVDLQGNHKSFLAEFLDFNRIYSIFWFTFCFVIPILDKSFVGFSKWVRRLNLPIVPIWMGVLFPLNYLVYKVIELYFLNPLWQTQSEVKETVFAILFVSVSIWFGMELQKNRGDDLNQTSHNPA
jgi:hypothetical protein